MKQIKFLIWCYYNIIIFDIYNDYNCYYIIYEYNIIIKKIEIYSIY